MPRKKKSKFYLVTAPMGHQGTSHTGEITFNIRADSITKAISIAMNMPGVKHDRYALSAKEISPEEYYNNRQLNAYERYKKDETVGR